MRIAGKNRLQMEMSCLEDRITSKAPFADPQQVIQYLGLYTNKIAISKSRIVAMNESFRPHQS